MRISRLAILLATTLVLSAAFTGTAVAETVYRTTLQDTFETFDSTVWRARFNSFTPVTNVLYPSTGVAAADAGVLWLRPDAYRGDTFLQTRSSVITTLPAHVTYTARFPLSGYSYREAAIVLVRDDIGDGVGTWGAPLVSQLLGQTDHFWENNPQVSVVEADGTSHSAIQPGAAVIIPTDTWLGGEMWLYADHVTTTFNGVTLTTYADVASVLRAGSLRLLFCTADDYGRGGFQLDSVRVEEASPTVAPVQPPASRRAGRGRGHQYAYGRGKGRGHGYGWRGK